MNKFWTFIGFLNRLKEMDWTGRRKGLTDKEKEYIDQAPSQNPYGLIGLILGGAAFTFGPKYGLIPILGVVFCMVTVFTFDKEKEDNPWTFYIGIVLSLIGLIMFIAGEGHNLIF
ncbi:cell division protein FtsK [Sporosarcina sp. Sa2YVA2]|uniref:Cell division protein FtsK n=1 Tax=Sporosarcina quadrami TaxID=2762234 RepID=A0ABR8U8D4_9BACL|nr:cell division protein FtsK [Sporosarcina quadrami]MBD7984293.1 cell division protein FtsK [Sporosarcina quadrami]